MRIHTFSLSIHDDEIEKIKIEKLIELHLHDVDDECEEEKKYVHILDYIDAHAHDGARLFVFTVSFRKMQSMRLRYRTQHHGHFDEKLIPDN